MQNLYRQKRLSARMTITLGILKTTFELGEATLAAFRRSRDTNFKKSSPQTISRLLYRLTKQGLIARSGDHRRSIWRLTPRGLKFHQVTRDPQIPSKDGISRVVIFDIPERERRKRDLLRQELVACNFEQLQKSVWIGHNPLPSEFIKFADDLDLAGKMHIFKIAEKGTIRIKPS